jgi:hypothetical protein
VNTDDAPQAVADQEVGYAFPLKALRRWSTQMTELVHTGDQVLARFNFIGSTCSDGGVPLKFVYAVQLEADGDDYLIRHMHAEPAKDHLGYRSMCSYKSNGDEIIHLLQAAHPLAGRPLSDVLSWHPERNPAGCICSAENRNHKWLMVLQTIHFSLVGSKEER